MGKKRGIERPPTGLSLNERAKEKKGKLTVFGGVEGNRKDRNPVIQAKTKTDQWGFRKSRTEKQGRHI